MSEHPITLEGVSKRYPGSLDGRQIIRSISLSIHAGQRLAIVGPNGSGKTTLLKLILGLIQPDTGRIRGCLDHDSRSISYIPQDYRNALFPWLTVRANIALYIGQPELNWRDDFHSWLGSMKSAIDMETYPYRLSGGEQQILVLLAALAKHPQYVIADEPLSAIDLHKKGIVLHGLIDWLQDHKPTFIMVSHSLEDALLLSDRVIVLSQRSDQIHADIAVNQPWPRNLEWVYGNQGRALIETITGCFE